MLTRLKAVYARDWRFSLAALILALFIGAVACWNGVKSDEAYDEVDAIRAQQAADERAVRP